MSAILRRLPPFSRGGGGGGGERVILQIIRGALLQQNISRLLRPVLGELCVVVQVRRVDEYITKRHFMLNVNGSITYIKTIGIRYDLCNLVF